MKEEKLIYLLKKMNQFEPSSYDLTELYEKVNSRVKNQSSTNLWETFSVIFSVKSYRLLFVSALTVILFVVTFSSVEFNINNKVQLAATQIQIAVSSNKLEKAKLAFQLSQSQFTEIKKGNNNIQQKLDGLSDSTSRTNSYLASLNLMGEKGQYTNQQCLAIYSEYHTYLEDLKETIDLKLAKIKDNSTKNRLISFQEQLTSFEKQAENRLKLY